MKIKDLAKVERATAQEILYETMKKENQIAKILIEIAKDLEK